MARKQTLLTEHDIICIVEGLNDTFPKCSFKDISTVEEYLFNCKLGKEFYKELKAALCVDEDCEKYKTGTTYTAGTIVVYRGVKKIALEDTNTIPSTYAKWDNAPKFCGDNAECFNSFWCDYLMPYLAWYVMAHKSLSMGSRFEDDGSHVKVYNSSISVPAGDADLKRKNKFYWTQVNMAFANMEAYAEGVECLTNFCKFDEVCCVAPTRKRRGRWH